ncbi:NYN domain-containing protein [Amnibacterium flavum]|uniref:HTH OST-type domain-containing protein n=1 Tax=Amnibacterium flavum TaxID=2173173 RepID=A0A2V1HP34_9MICO|nr:NYN domain-containing protein [Amnibacterium flavum]PVZ94285.1 hypothetical protein DDQ50_11125 [Amnibacterium flavum]
MADQTEGRVAVYIDFDNIVISRYDQLHGNGAWRRDNARTVAPDSSGGPDDVSAKLAAAEVEVGAILDYASSFGTVAISRAYADWSVPANASYRRQLVNRAVDLTQLFPVTQALKNGADIRLSVDVLEDLFRLPDLTHVVIVAGDSDYIALAQRCKRLGRFVLGIGVSGRTSPALIAACDHFEMYDSIPGATEPRVLEEDDDRDDEVAVETIVAEPAPKSRRGGKAAAEAAAADPAATPPGGNPVDRPATKMSDKAATRLLVRALELLQAKDDDEWKNAASVKSQIRRLDPSFSERPLGYKSFTEFIRSRNSLVEFKAEGNERLVRLR